MITTALAALALAICPTQGARYNCVVDGDTLWWQGEKIRIAEIDAPEIQGRCPAERALAIRSRRRSLPCAPRPECRVLQRSSPGSMRKA